MIDKWGDGVVPPPLYNRKMEFAIMTNTKHDYPTPSTCRVCREWERDMNGTLATLESERAIRGRLLEALDYLLEQTVDMDLKYGIGLSEGEEDARQKALAVIAKATA